MRKLDEPGRKRLQALLPPLLAGCRAPAPAPARNQVLRRVLRIIEAIGQRSAYFALLQENAAARARLVELCGHGDFLAQQIASYPLLLDELIDERLLAELPGRAELERGARARGSSSCRTTIPSIRSRRCAISNARPSSGWPSPISPGGCRVMRVSDRLTEIAEIIVEHAMELGWRQITRAIRCCRCAARAPGGGR